MSGVTTWALCWRVERRDGVTIGTTDHDRDLLIDGVVHRAAPGMTPSAIQRSIGLDPDSMDVAGALSSEAITAGDLADGRWEGARVTLFQVDWAVGGARVALGGGDRVALGGGTIGAVEVADGGFTAELRGAAARFDAAVVEETSAGCRAELGDVRCRVAMATRRRFARATLAGEVATIDAVEPHADAYGGGTVRWMGGANCGLESAVARSEGTVLRLRSAPPHAVEMPVLVELIEGCDKRFATCVARFANAANFRGEPFLPGIDLLTRYPGE